MADEWTVEIEACEEESFEGERFTRWVRLRGPDGAVANTGYPVGTIAEARALALGMRVAIRTLNPTSVVLVVDCDEVPESSDEDDDSSDVDGCRWPSDREDFHADG